MPLMFGHKDMVWFLYSKTNNLTNADWNEMDGIRLLHSCVSSNLYAIYSIS